MKSLILELHRLFNTIERYKFPFEKQEKDIPINGIYILFEAGETFEGFDRIVRIGTHTGENQLHSRLKEHFVNENKNRSIFRKNIGRCFLNKENNEYLRVWNFDTTSKIDKEKYLKFIDHNFEYQLEGKISNYIRMNFSFCTFEVKSKEERLFWEKKIISTLARYAIIKPSPLWLGNFSPKDKIRNNGLWQVNNLNNKILSLEEIGELRQIVKGMKNKTGLTQ